MDTALFVTSAGETKEDSTFVCFTESKDKEVRLCVLRDIHVKKNKKKTLHIKFESVPKILFLSNIYISKNTCSAL